MDHPATGGRARFIGYEPGTLRFFNSRWHSFSEAQLQQFVDHSEQAGMTHMWLSLSTSPRSVMNEVLFHALQNKQQVKDKLDYLIAAGIQPVLEIGTQEYMVDQLGSNPTAMKDYIAEAAAEFCPGRCKVAFPYREMTDLYIGVEINERMSRYADHLQALDLPGITKGIHLRSLEAPDTRMFSGVSGPIVWLMQYPFDQSATDDFTAEDDNGTRVFKGGAAWLEYWTTNRINAVGSKLIGSIAMEHSIGMSGWGTVHTQAEAELRGTEFLKADHCLADWSGGAA